MGLNCSVTVLLCFVIFISILELNAQQDYNDKNYNELYDDKTYYEVNEVNENDTRRNMRPNNLRRRRRPGFMRGQRVRHARRRPMRFPHMRPFWNRQKQDEESTNEIVYPKGVSHAQQLNTGPPNSVPRRNYPQELLSADQFYDEKLSDPRLPPEPPANPKELSKKLLNKYRKAMRLKNQPPTQIELEKKYGFLADMDPEKRNSFKIPSREFCLKADLSKLDSIVLPWYHHYCELYDDKVKEDYAKNNGPIRNLPAFRKVLDHIQEFKKRNRIRAAKTIALENSIINKPLFGTN